MSADTGYRDRTLTERQRAHRWWAVPLVLIVLAGIGLLIAAAYTGWRPWKGAGPQQADRQVPAGALDDYIPEDSAAVLQVNLGPMLASPAARQHLEQPLRELARTGAQRYRWPGLVGVNLASDVDWVRLSFPAGNNNQPLWVAHGRFDPSRFEVGPGKLEKKPEDGFALYENAGPPATTIAPAGDALLVCDNRASVVTALRHADEKRPSAPHDERLRQLLGEVDRGQSLWLAMDFKKLGPVGKIENTGLEMVLRPVLDSAETARGGLTLAEDVKADFHFQSAGEEKARKLEGVLRNTCTAADGIAKLGLGVHKDLLPLFRLLGTGQVSREGTAVRLQCRLPADQLGP